MDQSSPAPSVSKTKIFLIGGLIIICAGVAVYLFSSKTVNAPTPITNTTPGTGTVATVPPVVTQQGGYKNGTYAADGAYTSPAGTEMLGVSVTLTNDVITDAQVSVKAQVPASKHWQQVFTDNYKQYVVGKNINEVNLTKVSGSSLTPKGFNDAIQKIKTQAKS